MSTEVGAYYAAKTGIGDHVVSRIPISKASPRYRYIMKTGERTRDEWKNKSTRALLREYHKLFKKIKDAGIRSRLRSVAQEISKRFSKVLYDNARNNLEKTYIDIKGVTSRSLGYDPVFGHIDDNVIKTLDQEGIMWGAYKGLGTDMSKKLNDIIDESFRVEIRPSMDEIRKNMEEVVKLSEGRLEGIISTEVARVTNVAKYQSYNERDPSGERTYTWRGPPWDERRSSKHCEWVKQQVADEGGSVTLSRMRALWKEASRRFNGPKWVYRDGVLHPRCRHVLEVLPR